MHAYTSCNMWHDTYENEEELVEKSEKKTWRINKRSITNKDLNEEIKERMS